MRGPMGRSRGRASARARSRLDHPVPHFSPDVWIGRVAVGADCVRAQIPRLGNHRPKGAPGGQWAHRAGAGPAPLAPVVVA